MRTLSGLSARYLLQRRARTLLTVAGVSLGVATFFAAASGMASVNRGIDRLIEGFGGRAEVVAVAAGGFDAAVDADAAEPITAIEGVDDTTHIYSFTSAFRNPATDDTAASQYGTIDLGAPRVLGIDLADASALYDFSLSSGNSFRPGRAELTLPEQLADTLGVVPGDRLELDTPGGPRTLLVVGVLDNAGLGLFNEGNVVFTSIEQARVLAGAGETVSLVSIGLDEGVDPAAWIDAHQGDVDAQFSVLPVDDLAAPVKLVAQSFGATIRGLGLVVLFVSAFLIYLTLSTAVAERGRTIGVLRALGSRRRSVARLVVVEALILGTVATGLGLALGSLLAIFVVAQVGGTSNPIPTAGVVVTPGVLAGSVLLGIGVTVVAALVPARRAAAVEPVEAIRDTPPAPPTRVRSWVPGAAMLALGLGLMVVLPEASTTLAIFPTLLGAVLLVPAALPPLARLVTRAGSRVGAGMESMVAPYMTRQRTRAAQTVGLAMVVMAMTTALGAISTSFGETTRRQIEAQFGADVQVTAPSTLDPELVADVEATAGVEATSRRWMGWTEVRARDAEQRTRFWAIDPETYFTVAGFSWADGSDDATRAALARGGNVVIPEGLAEELDVGRGDRLVLETARGHESFEVAGVFESVGSTRSPDAFSAVAVGVGDGRERFATGDPLALDLAVEEGVDPDEIATALEERFADRTGLIVRTAAETKEFLATRINAITTAIVIIIGTSAIVSALGLANTMAVSMMERRREVGVLRAIGTYRRQVRRLATLEAGALVAVAALLAVPLGSLISRPLVDALSAAAGNVVGYVYPWRWLGVVAFLAVGIGMTAALVPARRAAAVDVVDALRFE